MNKNNPNNKVIEGIYPAVVTPWLDNNEVDMISFEKMLEFYVKSAVAGVVISGTTGESASLTEDEFIKIVEFAVKFIAGRVHVMVGAGSNSTQKALHLTKLAQKLGADSVLLVTPYYNKPNPRGVYAHYRHIHDNSEIPIVLYNVPSRTNVDLKSNEVFELLKLPRVVGLKDATGDLSRQLALKKMVEESELKSKHFIQLSGDDHTAYAFYSQGGQGAISVVANVFPKECVEIFALVKQAKHNEALIIQQSLIEAIDAMFCEINPVPVKYALYQKKLISSPAVRLPLVELSEAGIKQVNKALKI